MENSNIESVLSYLQDTYSCETSIDQFGMPNAICAANKLIETVQSLKKNHGFSFLTDICAVHYPSNSGAEFQVVYHLHNLPQNLRLRLKVNLSQDNITVPTLVNEFSGANWMERETFDFYGVQFEGHPDLRRILNVDDMDYHPLRKEYALEDETRDDKNDTFFGR